MKRIRVRASSLKNTQFCPGYIQLAEKTDSESPATRAGTMFHAYLEEYFEHGEEAATKALPLLWNRYGEGLDDRKSEIREDIQRFTQWLKDRNFPAATFLEEELIYSYGNCDLVGHADYIRLDGDLAIITDWKYYKDPSYLPDIDKDLQMMAYALMTSKRCGVKRVQVERILLKHCHVDRVTYFEETLEEAQEKINAILRNVEANYGRLVVGTHCDSCIIRGSCPTFKEQADKIISGFRYKGGEVASEEEALEILKALPAAKKVVKEAEDQVRKYCQAFAVRDSRKRVYTQKQFEVRDTAIRHTDAAAELVRLGGNPFNYAKLSVPAIRKCLEDSGRHSEEDINEILDMWRDTGIIAPSVRSRWSWVEDEKDEL